MIRAFLLLFTLSALTVSHSAKAQLTIGQELPHNLTAADQHGKKQSLDTIKGANGAVLIFVRSADWCPYCKTQLTELNDAQADIEKLGYGLASVSYDDAALLKAFSDEHSINYPMLSDKNSEIIKAFGILNEETQPGTRFYGIPHPTIYIVNADGLVQARLAEEGYKKRPPASLIIDTIKSITDK